MANSVVELTGTLKQVPSPGSVFGEISSTEEVCEGSIAQVPSPPKVRELGVGTLADGVFQDLADCLEKTHSDRVAAEAAFHQMLAEIKGIPGLKTAKTMTVNYTMAYVTLRLENGQVIEKPISQIRKEIKALTPAAAEEVDSRFDGYQAKFKTLLRRLKISPLAHFDGKSESLASSLGKDPLYLDNRSTPAHIYHQQALNLKSDVSKKRSEKVGILSLVQKHSQDEIRRREIVKPILEAEHFFFQFRDKLNHQLDQLREKQLKAVDEDQKRQLEMQMTHLDHLRESLESANRQALWANAMHKGPENCYEALLRDYYENLYPEPKAGQPKRPSFEQFRDRQSFDTEPFKQRAAKTASLQITDLAAHISFCLKHGIEPGPHHINRLLHTAFCAEEPESLDFDKLLGLYLPPEVADIARRAISEAKVFVAALKPKIDDLAGKMTAEEMLRAAVKWPELQDRQAPTAVQKAGNAVRDFFSKFKGRS